MTAFPALAEAQGKLKDRRKQLAAIFEEAGPEVDLSKVKSVSGDSREIAEHIKKLNDEMADLGKDVDRLKSVQSAADAVKAAEEAGEPVETGAPAAKGRKSFGDLFMESKAGSDLKGHTVELKYDIKALFDTATGWAPEVTRGPRIVLDEQRPIQVVDLIPQRSTGQTSIAYMEETTFTNAAAETAEGGAKPEAALGLTERTSPVRKIAVWIPVTDEQLEDAEGIRQYLDNRLTFMVRQRLDQQIVSGNGVAPNLLGLLNVAGIQTQAKGTDPTPDAVYKAITKVRVTGQSTPNLVVFHPNDWQDVRLLRTADGIYIWGNPSESGPERIWGLQVAQVQAATENTAVVLDTSFTELAVKKGLDVKVSDSHSDYFVTNKQAVRAEMRAAFTVYRPSAVCTVTGV